MNGLARAAAVASACVVWALAGAQTLSTQSGPVNVESLARLEHPWGMEFLPDGRLLITEKPGRLRVFAEGKLSEPIEGVPKVAFRGQGGLLDVTVDPRFSSNGFVYLSYAEPAEKQPPGAKDTHDPRFGDFSDLEDNVLKGQAVARGRLEGNSLRDVSVIWRQEPKTIGRGHFGGRLLFAPDGTLFITSGDRMRFEPAQDLGTTLGKVVRIRPDGSVPEDNPFVKREGARPEIWSYGHRNPLGAAVHPETRQLWTHEMGPLGGDELNRIEPGRNYGWPTVSEGMHYNKARIPPHSSQPEIVAPVKVWTPVISPSGFAFYTGDRFPGWEGSALIGGLTAQGVVRVTFSGNSAKEAERIDVGKRIRDVIEAPDGAVLLLTDGPDGELLRLTPATQGSE